MDNNRREFFFGEAGSTERSLLDLKSKIPSFEHVNADIRDIDALRRIFAKYKNDLSLIIHCAAQPSHDWAASNIREDFSINTLGTYNMLECYEEFSPNSVFIHLVRIKCMAIIQINISTKKLVIDFPRWMLN